MLLESGFVLGEPDFDMSDGLHHHLPPLRWPTIPLSVEVHSGPNWPLRAQPPPLAEILEGAVPSALGIDGILAPHPLHHTLILASHAWRHGPLLVLRDLVDIAAISAELDRAELDRLASRWGITRVWNTTISAVDALFYGGRRTAPLRSWARHLEPVRERTVFENHLERWLHAFWELPAAPALQQTVHVLRSELAPVEGESWGRKVSRTAAALRNPGAKVERRPSVSQQAMPQPAEQIDPVAAHADDEAHGGPD